MACWMLSALFCAVVGGHGDCTIVQFTATWCEPCQQMEPALQQLRREGWAIQTVDVDRQPNLVKQFHIENLPTLAIICRDQEVDRLVGAAPYERILERVQRAAARNQSGGVRGEGEGSGLATVASASATSEHANCDHAHGPPGNPVQSSGPIVRGQSPGLTGFPLLATAATTGGSTSTSEFTTPSNQLSFDFQTPAAAHSQPSQDIARVTGPTDAERRATLPTLSPEQAIARAAAATVRIRVDEANSTAYGTGTIVDVRGEEALILTCGHLFREMQPHSQLTIDLFPGTAQEVNLPSELIDFKAEGEDIGLISFRIPTPIEPVPILGRGEPVSVGQSAFSFGCDRGSDPTRRDTQIKSINRYLGADNIEIVGAPVMGRSGGGLFDAQGRLIGVCNAANAEDDEGIYASADVVYTQIERLGLSELFTGSHPSSGANAAHAQLASAPLAAPSPHQSAVSPSAPSPSAPSAPSAPNAANSPRQGAVAPVAPFAAPQTAGGWQQSGESQAAAVAAGANSAGNDRGLQWPDQSATVPTSLADNSSSSAVGGQVPGQGAVTASNTRQLICIVRDAGGQEKVVTIDAPPAELLEMIQQSSKTRR